MKKILLTIVVLLANLMAAHADNISVADMVITAGKTASADIYLNNSSSNLVGFQMDVTLPEGITINKAGCSLSSRFADADQSLTIGKQGNNVYRLTSTSLSLVPITGVSGKIFTLSLQASSTSQGGTATISNIRFVTTNSDRIALNDASFSISIKKATLAIKSTGSGHASFNGTSIRSTTKSFTINEGSSATISFAPDDGYRIKSIKKDGVNVTSSLSNNKYTVSNIQGNTTVEVEFEAITHTLSIKATGNGGAVYDGTIIRNKTMTFTVNEGSSCTVRFTPDNGYRIKSVKLNSTNITSSVTKNQYSISNITADTTLEVEFEAIPPTTYTLSIKANGNGSASYSGSSVRNGTKSFTVNEGTAHTVTFTPDAGYKIKSVKKDGIIVSVTDNKYTISNIQSNTTVEVEFEAITHSLSINASGSGVATYDGTNIRNRTTSFTINEGSSAIVKFIPDNGYRIKSVKVNTTDVTSGVTNNQYTINNITADTTLEVEFEAIPPTTYTLSIKATGNGSASYNGSFVRNGTKSFTVNEGTAHTITFTPDAGYKIKSVKKDGIIVSVTDNKYTISNIQSNTTVEVEFEPITHSLSIKASGSGVATYDGTDIRNRTTSFTINEGSSATVKFIPDNGYRIKSVKVNTTDVTSGVTNNQYTINNITADTTLEAEFEAIPPTTYTLSIKATGNGSASYNGSSVRNGTKSFTVNEGTAHTVTFTPDAGCKIKSVKKDGIIVSVTDNQYTISNIQSNTTVEVEFKAITHLLNISVVGNGRVTYNSNVFRESSRSFAVNEGTSATVYFTPDENESLQSVKLNGMDVTLNVSNNIFIVKDIASDQNLEVMFSSNINTLYEELGIAISMLNNELNEFSSYITSNCYYDVFEEANATVSVIQAQITAIHRNYAAIGDTISRGYRPNEVAEITASLMELSQIVETLSTQIDETRANLFE